MVGMRTLPKLEQEIVEQIEEAWAKPQGVGEKRGEDSCSLQNNLPVGLPARGPGGGWSA